MQLSGCILVKNNAKSIGYAVESLYKYVDELVIIDSGSTDGTIEIAKRYTDRIVFNKFKDFADQRNFAITQCQGDWIFMLDADEMVGENFQEVRKLLDGKFRSIAIPRYHIVNLEPLSYIVNKPHYLDWQTRFFKNDGKSHFYSPVHHKLSNYRPRLRCAITNVFHYDLLFKTYDARKKQMDFYTAMDKHAGYNAMYLIEDYPYHTAETVESIDQYLLDRLRKDNNLISHELHSVAWRTAYAKFLYNMRSEISKLRYKIGI